MLITERLWLERIRVAHATEMTAVLSDPVIYNFIGGEPPTEDDLRSRYEFLEGQSSPDGTESWLNWIVKERRTNDAVGVMQATVADFGTKAEIAWIVAPMWEGRGDAREAAAAVVAWLGSNSVTLIVAHVNPRHEASRRVAAAIGLQQTEVFQDGEHRWERTIGVRA